MNGGFSVDAESDHLKARIAWFYFVAGMTQQEIADQLEITRLRVNKIIGIVRAEGAVVVDLRMPMIECIKLEEELKVRFGLEEVMVVPAVQDYQGSQRTIGEAAGIVLDSHVSRRHGIGVGWGNTLSFAVRRITERRLKNSWVVGMMGAVARGSGINTFELSTALAQSLDVECHYLTAPIYCATSEARAILLQHDEISAVMKKAEEAEVGLVSCGDLTHRSPVMPLAVIKENLPALLELGAVGEVLGCFLDPDGNIVPHPINQSIMALPLEELKKKPVSILASGGRTKLPIIRSVLRGRYVNRLVTDDVVARALVYES
ncbi:MAG: sugar-binding domain-containing protein [Shinella sp.]|nr:sugar-binding domain-containing protein [Shinella sp.]